MKVHDVVGAVVHRHGVAVVRGGGDAVHTGRQRQTIDVVVDVAGALVHRPSVAVQREHPRIGQRLARLGPQHEREQGGLDGLVGPPVQADGQRLEGRTYQRGLARTVEELDTFD